MIPVILKISDKVTINGESLVKGYEGQIDIWEIRHELEMPMLSDKSSNSRTSGRVVHGNVKCVTRLDKAYPKLMECCGKGTNLGKVVFSFVKMNEGSNTEILKYELTDTYVSKIGLMPAPADDNGQFSDVGSLPQVEFELNYQSVAITYSEYDNVGSKKGQVSCPPLTGLGG